MTIENSVDIMWENIIYPVIAYRYANVPIPKLERNRMKMYKLRHENLLSIEELIANALAQTIPYECQ